MANAGPKRILIVDDEEEALELLKLILEKAGYEVIPTTKGREAVTLAKAIHPDLIILDIMLPDMEGGEVAAVISEDPGCSEIPIVFLSGVIVTKKDNIPGQKAGKHFILAKPASANEILEMVNRALGH